MTNQTEQGAALAENPSPELLRVHQAGTTLANIAYNLAQRPGEPLTSDVVASLDACRREWDAACAAFKAARVALAKSTPEGYTSDDEAENFAMSKFASRADRDAAMLRELASLRAANSELAAAAIVRDGYALVPLEPTQAMLDAVAPFPEHLRAEHPDPADPWHKAMRAGASADQAAAAFAYRTMVAAHLKAATPGDSHATP